jgi:hypothetical protein
LHPVLYIISESQQVRAIKHVKNMKKVDVIKLKDDAEKVINEQFSKAFALLTEDKIIPLKKMAEMIGKSSSSTNEKLHEKRSNSLNTSQKAKILSAVSKIGDKIQKLNL